MPYIRYSSLIRAPLAYLLAFVVAGFGCTSPEEPQTGHDSRTTLLTNELSSLGIAVTTRDSVLFRVEGRLTDELFQASRSALISLDSLHALSVNFRTAPFTNLPDLASITNLQSLNLSGNDSLETLDGLPSLPRLQSLNLSGADNLVSLAGMPSLTNLRSLNLSSTPKLTSMDELAGLPRLETLDLSYNGSLTDLKHLAPMATLEVLDLSYCDSFHDLKSLPDLPGLRTIRLYNTAVTSSGLAAYASSHPGVTIDK